MGDPTDPVVAALAVLGAPLAAAARIAASHDHAAPLRTAADFAHAAGLPSHRPPAWCRRIAAALALGQRWIRLDPYRPVANDPASAAEAIRPYIAHEPVECFAVAMLTARRAVIGVEVVHRGTLAQVDAHPREVFRAAIRCGAHSIVIAHNHPSGDPTPSDADCNLVARMVEAGQAVGIPVVDSLIFAPGRSVSMLALGMLP